MKTTDISSENSKRKIVSTSADDTWSDNSFDNFVLWYEQ